jgi:4-amino-4-deoxychorismate mutase
VSGLDAYRQRLDELDDQIARLLGERFDVCREIAGFKRAHGVPMMQPGRVGEVRARYLDRGREVDLPPDFTEQLFQVLIAATCKMEDELMAEPAATAEPTATAATAATRSGAR